MSSRSREGGEAVVMAEREGLEERFFRSAERTFEEIGDPRARTAKIRSDFDTVIAVMDDEGVARHIREAIERTGSIVDKSEFIAAMTAAFRPLLDAYLRSPAKFEQAARERWRRESNFTPLSEILAYGQAGDVVHIHLASARAMSPGEQLRGVRDGLQKLAEVVARDETIQRITATSWIVAARPGLLEKLGFTVEPQDINDVERKEHFAEENRPVRRATMTREELLTRYRQT